MAEYYLFYLHMRIREGWVWGCEREWERKRESEFWNMEKKEIENYKEGMEESELDKGYREGEKEEEEEE